MSVKLPHLDGLNATEYWFLLECLKDTNMHKLENSQGFAGSFIDTVELKNGDRYVIDEMYEVITGVKKLERKENV